MTKKLTKPAQAKLCATPVFSWQGNEASAYHTPLFYQELKAGVIYPSILSAEHQNGRQDIL